MFCHLDVASLLNQMTIDLTPQLLLLRVESVLCRCSIALPGQDGAGQGSTCAPNVLVCSFISVQEDKLNLRMFFFFFNQQQQKQHPREMYSMPSDGSQVVGEIHRREHGMEEGTVKRGR